MGYYAKKTAFGVRALVQGADTEDASCYVMTVDEYQQIQNQIRTTDERVRDILQESERRRTQMLEDAECRFEMRTTDIVKQQRTHFEKKISELQILAEEKEEMIRRLTEKCDDLTAALYTQEQLQANLLRITRERANAARELRPKKEHDGYIVLETGQWIEKHQANDWEDGIDPADYRDPDDFQFAVDHALVKQIITETITWRSVIQTPYDATLPIMEISPRIEQELRENVLPELGVVDMVASEINGQWPDEEETTNGMKECILYRWRYRANYQRAGLWEVEVQTTQPLTIPAHRRPQAK